MEDTAILTYQRVLKMIEKAYPDFREIVKVTYFAEFVDHGNDKDLSKRGFHHFYNNFPKREKELNTDENINRYIEQASADLFYELLYPIAEEFIKSKNDQKTQFVYLYHLVNWCSTMFGLNREQIAIEIDRRHESAKQTTHRPS